MLKKGVIFFISLSITIFLSLYCNFFIADKTLWKIYIKAWLIYSSLILIGEILIILILTFLMDKVFKKYHLLPKDKNYKKVINLTIWGVIIGNIFFIAPFHKMLWFIVPIFQGFIIFIILNIYLKPKNSEKRGWKEILFKVQKGESKSKKYILLSLIVAIFFSIFGTFIQYGVLNIYNPHIKSLEYSMPGFKIKLK